MLRPRPLVAALVACVCAASATPAHALTPDSPQVKALVQKGIKFLETVDDNRVGARALFALTMLKADHKPDHPKIQSGLAAVREAAGKKAELEGMDVYSLCLCIIFLVEHDPKGHQQEIRTYLDQLLAVQKPNGGWGYAGQQEGDTSMTQYAVLSMWELSHSGINTPVAPWENVTSWLLRTQDPSGAWGYHGVDPGSMKLVTQSETRASMVSAGLGSLYICADQFQYRRQSGSTSGASGPASAPGALQIVRKPSAPAAPTAAIKMSAARVDHAALGAALDRGDAYMQKHYTIQPSESKLYFLYAFERYQSFRELSASPPFSPSNWYDEGVAHLEKIQAADGSWTDQWGNGPDTAFALLFLLRSSQRSIQKVNHLGPGTLISGRGLPDGKEVDLRLGQARQKPLAGPAEQLLAAIEDPSHPDYLRAVEGLEEKVNTAAPGNLGRLSDRLRRMAGGNAPEARAAALRALARTRDLDNVPLILAALSDPDDDVFVAAEEALQFMSRTIPTASDNDGINAARRASSARKWRAWYLSIRPQAKLED